MKQIVESECLTHVSRVSVIVYESTSPGGFSHDACRLSTPELCRVMVRNAMGTGEHTHTSQLGHSGAIMNNNSALRPHKCVFVDKHTHTPVRPCKDTDVFTFPLLVVTVMVYCLPGVRTLNVHSLLFGSTSLVSMVTLSGRCRRYINWQSRFHRGYY